MRAVQKTLILAVAALLGPAAAYAEEAPDFQGKNVTVLIGGESNAGFDTYGRVFARFLGAHLPGRPNVIVQNMPGAGSLVATNYIYNVAPRDGTEIGVIGQVAAINQILEMKGVHYDVRKLVWIGRFTSNSQLLYTWHTSPVKTIADAFTHPVVVAGTSAASTSVIFPHLMDDLLGTKFKVIQGYKGPASANLAMESGEVEGAASPWNDIKAKHAEWLRDKKINLIVQYNLTRNPEISDIPTVVDIARNQGQRQLLGLFAAGGDVGYPVVAPPGLEPPVAAALRKAFDEVMKDPEFLAAAKKENLTLDPVPGTKLQQINAEALDVPEKIVEEAKKYASGG